MRIFKGNAKQFLMQFGKGGPLELPTTATGYGAEVGRYIFGIDAFHGATMVGHFLA